MEAEQLNQSNSEVVTPVIGESPAPAEAVAESEKPVGEVQMNESEASVEPAADTSVTASPAAVTEPAGVVAPETESVPEVDMEAEPSDVEKSAPEESLPAVEEPVAIVTEEAKQDEPTPVADTSVTTEQEATKVANESSLSEETPMEEGVPETDGTSLTVAPLIEPAAVDPPANGDGESVAQTAADITSEVSNSESLTDKLVSDIKVDSDDKDAAVLNQSTNGNGTKSDSASPQQPAASASVKKPKIDLASMAVRQYLDHTVVPILLSGLATVAKVRPDHPIDFLAQYLLENKFKYDNNQENSSINGNQ